MLRLVTSPLHFGMRMRGADEDSWGNGQPESFQSGRSHRDRGCGAGDDGLAELGSWCPRPSPVAQIALTENSPPRRGTQSRLCATWVSAHPDRVKAVPVENEEMGEDDRSGSSRIRLVLYPAYPTRWLIDALRLLSNEHSASLLNVNGVSTRRRAWARRYARDNASRRVERVTMLHG